MELTEARGSGPLKEQKQQKKKKKGHRYTHHIIR